MYALMDGSSLLCLQLQLLTPQFTNREWQEKQLSRANPSACVSELHKWRANVHSLEDHEWSLSQPAAHQSQPLCAGN